MKFELERPQRIVEYFGLKIVVPHDTAYLGTDQEGRITAHSDEPWTEPCFWEGYELGEVAKVKPLLNIYFGDTLKKYKPEEI